MNPRRRTIKWEEEEDKPRWTCTTRNFQPENEKDLLREIKEQDNPIRNHLVEKLDKGVKWYIIVFAEFKKDVVAADGTNN